MYPIDARTVDDRAEPHEPATRVPQTTADVPEVDRESPILVAPNDAPVARRTAGAAPNVLGPRPHRPEVLERSRPVDAGAGRVAEPASEAAPAVSAPDQAARRPLPAEPGHPQVTAPTTTGPVPGLPDRPSEPARNLVASAVATDAVAEPAGSGSVPADPGGDDLEPPSPGRTGIAGLGEPAADTGTTPTDPAGASRTPWAGSAPRSRAAPDLAGEPPASAESEVSHQAAGSRRTGVLDVLGHLELDRRRAELIGIAEGALLEAERAGQTPWSPPIERQLAELRHPGLRVEGLHRRLADLQNRGLEPQRLQALRSAVDRAVAADRAIESTVRADAQRLREMLSAFMADPAVTTGWRDQDATAAEPPCGPATAVALQALFPGRHRILPDYTDPAATAAAPHLSTPASGWSFLLGNSPADFGQGPRAHRETVAHLTDPRGPVMPGPVERVAVIVDSYSPDHRSDGAHAYLAARLSNGELIRLDLSEDTGPRRLEPPDDEVLFREVYALDRQGNALEPPPDRVSRRRTPSLTGKPETGSSQPNDRQGTHDGAADDRPSGRDIAPRVNEPATTTHVEPVPAPDQELGIGTRVGELDQDTHIEAVEVPPNSSGFRGWYMRMTTTPVGILVSGSLTASMGTSITGMSAALSVNVLTGSAVMASLVTSARNLASVLATIPAGIAADRFDQRRVVVTSSLVGIGAATLGVFAIGFSWLLAPIAVAGGVATAIFLSTVADSFGRSSQARLAKRYAELGTDNEQKEVGRLQIRQGQIASMTGSFLGPTLTALHSSVPFAAKAASYLINLAALRKVHRTFGEPPEVGEGHGHPQRVKAENAIRVNETAPGTLVNRVDPSTRVESSTEYAERTAKELSSPRTKVDPEATEDPATAPDGPNADQSAEAADPDEGTGEEPAPAGWWERALDNVRSAFDSVRKDGYLRGMLLVAGPIGTLATGIQTQRFIEFMAQMPPWQAGVLAATTGAAGIAGSMLAKLFKKATVKSLEPLTMAFWAVTTIPSALWLNPFLLVLSTLPTSALGMAANTKMSDYMHDADKKNFAGKRLARMKGVDTFMGSAGQIVGGTAGGFLLSGLGLSVTGFVQVGVLGVAALAAGIYGFRYRKHTPGGDREA